MFNIGRIVEIDNRAFTPGAIERAGRLGLDVEALRRDGREHMHYTSVYINESMGPTSDGLIQWLIGEALGDFSYVWLDNNQCRMSVEEWWRYANAYYHYLRVTANLEAWSSTEIASAQSAYIQAVAVYSAHTTLETVNS